MNDSLGARVELTDKTDPARSNAPPNASRPLNILPQLVAAPPSCVTVLDHRAPHAIDGLVL